MRQPAMDAGLSIMHHGPPCGQTQRQGSCPALPRAGWGPWRKRSHGRLLWAASLRPPEKRQRSESRQLTAG